MYTINSHRNYLIISPFLCLLLHFKHLWWSNVRWELVLLSQEFHPPSLSKCPCLLPLPSFLSSFLPSNTYFFLSFLLSHFCKNWLSFYKFRVYNFFFLLLSQFSTLSKTDSIFQYTYLRPVVSVKNPTLIPTSHWKRWFRPCRGDRVNPLVTSSVWCNQIWKQFENWHFPRSYNFLIVDLILILKTPTCPYSCVAQVIICIELVKTCGS